MTEEERTRLTGVKNKFYAAFSELCANHIAMMPEHTEAETIDVLGDMTSIYGSNYEEHLTTRRKILAGRKTRDDQNH
jgi:hypothetical protein